MMSKRLICFLLLSVALHLLLVWLPGFAPHPPSGGSAAHPNAGGGRMEIRLKMLDAPAVAVVPAPSGPLAQQEAEPARPELDTVAEDAASTGAATAATSPLPILPASLPRGFDRDAYLPGDTLDVHPSPEQPIIIGLNDPERMQRDKGRVILYVYVGAGGQVDHVDIDSSDVPPEISESLAGIFRAARMRPGMKDDQPVNARMKILVEFEVR